jgi:hypothetical protein
MAGTPRAVFVFALDSEPFVFTSLEAASGWMEAVDVRDGEYLALFTDEGRVIRAAATPKFKVVLTLTDEYDLLTFRDLLRERCPDVKWQGQPGEVLALGNALLEQEWRKRWPRRPRWLDARLHGESPPTL